MYFTVYAPLRVINVVPVPVSVTIRVSVSFSVLLLVHFYVLLPAPVQILVLFSTVVHVSLFLCSWSCSFLLLSVYFSVLVPSFTYFLCL